MSYFSAGRGSGKARSENKEVRRLTHRTLIRGAVAAPLATCAGTLLANAANASPGSASGPFFIRNASKTKISFWPHTHPPMIEQNKKMIAEFIQANPDIEVDPKAIDYDSLDALRAAYIPNALEGATVDGKIYGLTSEFNVTAAIINTAAFSEAGLDPKAPPVTCAEVGRQGQKLVTKDGDTMTRCGFDFL